MSKTTRSVLIGSGVLVAAFALFAAWLLGTAWYRVPHYDVSAAAELEVAILTPDEYDALIDTHARPFVYEIEASHGVHE